MGAAIRPVSAIYTFGQPRNPSIHGLRAPDSMYSGKSPLILGIRFFRKMCWLHLMLLASRVPLPVELRTRLAKISVDWRGAPVRISPSIAPRRREEEAVPES
jgi:hypothetical protein